jgi:hypothetical protein
MAFDPNSLGDDERYILTRLAAGEWATFSERTEKPRIAAAFIRHLMLGLSGPDGKPWPIAPTGVRVRSIHVEGLLDLCDAAGRDGAPLPALLLESCDFPDPIHLDHAHLARLSLKGSRFRELRGIDCALDGALDISHVGPYSVDGLPDQCWVEMPGSRVDGDVEAEEGHFIAPPKREPLPLGGIPNYAVNLRGATIQGRVLARYLVAGGGVIIAESRVGGSIEMRGATLTAREGAALQLQSALVDGALYILACEKRKEPFVARGRVWLLSTKMTGSLEADGGQFHNRTNDGSGVAIEAGNAEIGGATLFRNSFKAEGQVRLIGAKISGNLEADEGQFLNRTDDGLGRAIVADNAEIGGAVFFRRNFKSEGQVRLFGARIAGNFEADAGHFFNRTTDGVGVAIEAGNAEFGGAVYFRNGFNVEGVVRLIGARVSRDLEMRLARLDNHGTSRWSRAVFLDNARIGGRIAAGNGTQFTGVFSAPALMTGGGVDFSGARFSGAPDGVDGKAIDLTIAQIGGGLVFHDPQFGTPPSTVKGSVIMTRASIRGGLLAGKTTFAPGHTGARDNVSITAEGLDVEGDVFFDQTAEISGEMDFRGATFKRGFTVDCAKDSAVIWNLENASAQTLDDADGTGWGSSESIVKLDGFRYESLEAGEPENPKSLWQLLFGAFASNNAPHLAQRRLDWFERHFEPTHPYEPHPYVQLAQVFRRKGHDEESRHILHHKRWRAWSHTEGTLSKPFSWLFGVFFAFGYSTWHAIMTVLIFICIGTIGVKHLNATGILVIDSAPVASVAARDTPAVPQAIASAARTSLPCGDAVNPWLYAIDVFVPLIDLRQESKCEPSSDADVWRILKAGYALLGWIVTSLAILTFSGVLQRRGEDL